MSKRLNKSEIADCLNLFGPPPVLSTENKAGFEQILDRVMESLRPRDIIEVMTIRSFVHASWLIDRYSRAGTVGIERYAEQNRKIEAQRAKFYQERKKPAVSPLIPADVARLEELESNIDDAVDDIDKIFERADAERDHNRALEQSLEFQERLTRLIATQTAMRNDAFQQLEMYRAGLGQYAEQTTNKILDAEYHEVPPQLSHTPAPAVIPNVQPSQDSVKSTQ